jgi:DNA-binding HxlR family transcriptional regulator
VTERSYRQFCGIARALDIVGERWGLLVVRELVLGPKRFTDLRQGLPGIATNVLTERLRRLEHEGVVARRILPPPAGSSVYELTAYGEDLVPVLLALGRWGARTLGARTPGQPLLPGWLAVALKAFHDPRAAAGIRATVGLELAGERFTLRLVDGQLEIAAGCAGPVDLAISADPETLIAFLAGAPMTLHAEGDPLLLERLPQIFPFGAEVHAADAAVSFPA